MKAIFRYSIIRFRPFAETEEFANIGIVVLDIINQKIDFQVAPKRFARVRQFFEEKAYSAYARGVEALRVELGRASEYIPTLEHARADQIFSDLIRPRESSIAFSYPRVVQSDQALSDLTNSLFARFVKREIVLDNVEQELTKDIRKSLHRAGVSHFKSLKIDDDIIPVTLPLAHRGRTLRAIKPLAFSQKNPMGVVDYGAHWRKRLSYILEKGDVSEGNVLIAVSAPDQDDDAMVKAFLLATDELRKLPFPLVNADRFSINDEIVAFALQSIPLQGHLTN